MRTALLVGTAVLLFSGNVMHADSGGMIGLTFSGVNAVQNPNPNFLDLHQLTYSGITASGGTGYYDNIPDGSIASAPSSLYISANGGPDSADPYTVGFQQYGDDVFICTSLATNASLGPDEAIYTLTGMLAANKAPAILELQVTDTDGTFAVENASLFLTPEPSSLLLAATGLLGVAVIMRRRFALRR